MQQEKLNPLLKRVQPSATIVINELSRRLISEGKEIYKLGFGQSPFPVPEQIVNALKNNAHQKDYLPTKGLDVLRQEIALFFEKKYKLFVTKENILIGPGSKELLYDFQLAYDFEELLLPSPSWVSYEPQAILSGHKVVWLPTNEKDDWKINADTIVDHCKTKPEANRVIILNYPSNPLGVTYSKDELKKLSEVFRRFNIVVIADEIYAEVNHKGNHCTIAEFYQEGTIISTGLSKWAGAGGWRFGLFVFPKDLLYIQEAMAVIASETFTSVSAPIQFAAIEAYRKNNAIDEYVNNSRKILRAVGKYVYYELLNIGIIMPKPTGGFYLFPNFVKWKEKMKKKNIYTSTDLCNTLLKETGVALLPGEAFGLSDDYLTARLSYVDFDGEELLKIVGENPQLELDHEFVRKNCPQIEKAIQKIKSWVLSL